MPTPVSRTSISSERPLTRLSTVIAPPSGVNFTAFTSTLLSTCWRRFGSPSIGGRSPAMRRSTVIRLASAATDTPATTASSSAGSATGARSSTSLPLMIRETSRMSSISRACSPAFRPITSIACCARADVRVPLCSIGTQPRIAFSGVRSSCDSVARNSSLSRLASSAAASRASSASLRRVTITHTPLIATGRPSRYSTRPLPSHQRTVPSGATMRYSTSCGTPSVRARCTEASTRGRSSG